MTIAEAEAAPAPVRQHPLHSAAGHPSSGVGWTTPSPTTGDFTANTGEHR